MFVSRSYGEYENCCSNYRGLTPTIFVIPSFNHAGAGSEPRLATGLILENLGGMSMLAKCHLPTFPAKHSAQCPLVIAPYDLLHPITRQLLPNRVTNFAD